MDANVLIFERVKEELAEGATAFCDEAGFSRAFTTIMDSNITTLITAAVLFIVNRRSQGICCHIRSWHSDQHVHCALRYQIAPGSYGGPPPRYYGQTFRYGGV